VSASFQAALLGTAVDGNVVVVAFIRARFEIGPMDILMSETRITGGALSCNAFPSAFRKWPPAPTPPSWVETIPFEGLIREGSSACTGREGRRSSWNSANLLYLRTVDFDL